MKEKFKRVYNIGQKVCTDEHVVKGKEKNNPLMQYISIKPIKTGTKIWELACSCYGYLHGVKCIQGEVVEILTEGQHIGLLGTLLCNFVTRRL